MLFGIVQQAEGVVGRPGAATKHANHEIGIVLANLLHQPWPVIHDFQEVRPPSLSDPGEGTQNLVVDKLTEFLRWNAAVDVWIEHLKEVTELFSLGLLTEGVERLECAFILL